jgi:hypothetical protein
LGQLVQPLGEAVVTISVFPVATVMVIVTALRILAHHAIQGVRECVHRLFQRGS